MATQFKQVANNAKTTVLDNALNNTLPTLTFGVVPQGGGKFPQPGNGFFVTAYNDELYLDPGDDPDMRIGLCEARSGDNFTVIWGQRDTPINPIVGTPALRLFIVDEHINELQNAINDLEDKQTFTLPFTNLSEVTVTHNLGRKPAVTVIDSAGDEVMGDVNHVGLNQLIISFSASFTGTVLCN